MDNVISLLKNDPLVFIIVAIATVSLFLLFILAIYFNFIPAKIAAQLRQIRERPIMYFGLVGIVLALISILISFLLLPGFGRQLQKEGKAEQFSLNGNVVEIDKEKNIVTIVQVASNFQYKINVTTSTQILERGSQKKLSLEDINTGQTLEVVSTREPDTKRVVLAEKINVYPVMPTSNTLPSPDDNENGN